MFQDAFTDWIKDQTQYRSFPLIFKMKIHPFVRLKILASSGFSLLSCFQLPKSQLVFCFSCTPLNSVFRGSVSSLFCVFTVHFILHKDNCPNAGQVSPLSGRSWTPPSSESFCCSTRYCSHVPINF